MSPPNVDDAYAQDVELGDGQEAPHLEGVGEVQHGAQQIGSHTFGSANLSDHARAIMGNVHYVYNFCISPERLASYRRSAIKCLRESLDDIFGDSECSTSQTTSPQQEDKTPQNKGSAIDPKAAAHALAEAMTAAKIENRVPEISKLAFMALYRPADIVVQVIQDEYQAYRVKKVTTNGRGSLVLDCWSWSFDGFFIKSSCFVHVHFPDGVSAVPVDKLPAWPLHAIDTSIEEKLEKRGQMFWTLRFRMLVEYDSRSRYMIDMRNYQHLRGVPQLSPGVGETLSEAEMNARKPPQQNFALLLPATIKGYDIKDKKWQSLQVSRIVHVSWNRNLLSQLVLPESKKELILAHIQGHILERDYLSPSSRPGGLKFLFTGPQGTGKTMAAESIAEYTKRPLYTITIGDIGNNPEDAKKHLESAFYMCKLWGCVVLLDEADSFMEDHQSSDFRRKAMTSVFRRVLDNFEGILILTTNCTDQFSSIFTSRMQLPLIFPELDFDGRKAVWKGLLPRKYIMSEFSEWAAEHKFNGRQIKNMVETARRVAAFREEPLSVDHLRPIVDATIEFNRQ